MTILLRFIHVVFGALWVGAMAYQVFFLMPALSEAGPDSGKLMGAMARRRMPTIMLAMAILALVSGTWLLMRLMGGDAAGLMRTSMGKAYGWGGVAAFAAFLIGIFVVRPSMTKMMKLGESIATAPPDQRAAIQARMQTLRARGAALGKVVAALLLIALSLMAVARYL
jgi:uncharacterized membrane protein